MVSKLQIASFQKKILPYYKKFKRALPWRDTIDPYQILVSEVMLQQTQVDRVIPYYIRWMQKWPNEKSLATAEKDDVLRMWQGLGYNNRALRLWEAAKEVANRKFPNSYEELIHMKGIGPYTACAILAFAFNKEVPVLDTNIRRVLIHELKLKEDIGNDRLKEIALMCIPKGKSRVWHNALMDYGAMEATARKTQIKSISKQGKFEGSDREVRGWTLRQVLTTGKFSMKEATRKFPGKDVKRIVLKMKKDGLI